MINKIKNYFFPKNESSSKNTNDIVFSIHKNGNVDIEVFIRNDNETDSDYLANVLHQINYGLYSEDLFDILMNISKDHNEYKNFIQKTISKWSFYLLSNYSNIKDNKPVVSPSKFCLNNHD